MTQVLRERLVEGAARAEGVVIVVDVIRAYTTAAFALAAGAREIRLFAEVDDALRARAESPGAFLMGEVGGEPPPGFDHGNSPALLPVGELRDRMVIQRTSSGTRCAVAARRSRGLFLASLVVGAATARAVRRLEPDLVTIVESGGAGEGDDAVADRLEGLLLGSPPPLEETLERVRGCAAARQLVRGGRRGSPPEDVERCLESDRFDFAIVARRDGERLVATTVG